VRACHNGRYYIWIFAVYIPLSIWVTHRAVKEARKRNIAGWKFGLPMAFVMYHLVFWDWIPTVVIHKYYCATEAGFWVYKTVDEWKAENPGVLGVLINNKGAPSRSERFDDGHGRTSTYCLNKRFNWNVTQQDISSVLPIIRTEWELLDVKKSETLARYTDFGTSNSVKNTVSAPGPIKFWLKNKHCNNGGESKDTFRAFRDKFVGERK
jgi:hypothetical protein